MSRAVMCLVPANLKELNEKGVLGHILQRDLGGYWDKVITVHPFAHVDQQVALSEDRRHVVREYRWLTWSAVRDMIHTIKIGNVRAIKAHDPYAMGAIALLLSRVCRIPYVIMICSSYELEWHNTHKAIIRHHWIDNLVAWVTLKGAARVFGGSGDAMEWAIRSGASRSKSLVVRTGGVDERHFASLDTRTNRSQEFGLAGKRSMLCVSRLSREKFVEDAIVCLEHLSHSTDEHCELLLAGDGEFRPELEALAREHGVQDRVRFLGFLPQEKLIDLMYTVDVIVAPLSGSALVESALSGTPIVAYDIDWHRELITHSYSGMLAPWRNPREMAEAVVRILGDRALGVRLGRNARDKAIQQHGLQSLYKLEASCFNELVGGVNA
jgi:glycosyltransferase involved in cell wall biosynthesis